MAKPVKILQLLQLLSHRSLVTMDTILKVCKIPQRTAYRYINTLSEADIPVIYDKDRGGYFLPHESALKLEEFTRQELVILAASLELTKRHVNREYGQVISSLLRKVVIRQPEALEEIIGALEANSHGSPLPPDYSSQLSLTLVQFAAMTDLPARVTVANQSSGQEQIDLERCRLQFKQKWQLTRTAEADADTYDIDHVAYVAVR